MHLRQLVSTLVLVAGFCWSSQVGSFKFLPLHEPLLVKVHKGSPPHVAFEELFDSELPSEEWSSINRTKPLHLAPEKSPLPPLKVERIELAEMVFKKSSESLSLVSTQQPGAPADTQDWISELSSTQALRLQEAQKRSEVLDQDWNEPSTGVQGHHSIVGPIEITGGLALTNEHHIEVRRSDEGVLKELGRVDLSQGLYNIQVEEPMGTVIARLVDKEGKILGEGSFRLTQFTSAPSKNYQGPKLRIEPHPSFSGVVASFYNSRPQEVSPPQTRAAFIKGLAEVPVKKDGLAVMDNVTRGSVTVMRAAAPNHLQTTSIVVSGEEFKASLFPSSMIGALQDIVEQQRSVSLDGPPAIVWGRVSQGDKSISGAEIMIESQPDLQPIYFNELMLPDVTLQATSSNGLFAFVGVSKGFHSLLALRKDEMLGYQNVVVEEGSVALGDVAVASKKEAIPMRAFDAFSGQPMPARATLQSLDEEVDLNNGAATVNLPQVYRFGMMRVQPEGMDHVAARYFYNDKDDFIHAPLIRWSWLSNIKSYLRIDDQPNVGFVVGFVADEDFEVYLAGHEEFNPKNIVYFDLQGRILQGRKGMAGAGFIIFNVSREEHEVVIIGQRTQKIYSRLLPVDEGSLSVLSFREHN